MQELDKRAMGQRIRQIRLAAGLRQWELARILGTTQSAVHKYEHGVVPEPRRLIELARVGQTSIEWVLTGRHWENGSEGQQRLTPDVLVTASALRELDDQERDRVDEALRILREALQALTDETTGVPAPGAYLPALRDHGEATLRLVESAWRIQRAVLRHVAEQAVSRLDPGGDEPTAPRSEPGARSDD